ncbi:protein CLP1 homolog [Asparagus officinalis]|uniref:protein CLP1 homolog n=1 Tax=Asparagus officinalis TaxID=4686 RepID=UPI00098E047F|nr:protein CLP1 homolog [Asparagus officinalis]
MASRGKAFSHKEDQVLCSAWLNVSQDPILGTNQRKETMWVRITTLYHQNPGPERGIYPKSLSHFPFPTLSLSLHPPLSPFSFSSPAPDPRRRPTDEPRRCLPLSFSPPVSTISPSPVETPSLSSRSCEISRQIGLRVEVGPDTQIRIRLLSGTAEIFGTELPPDTWLSIPPRHKFAVFTWNDATVELEGISDVEYVADETPMVSYVNVHAILDVRRSRAKAAASSDVGNSQGPRVIVVGPTDSGKSSLCRMLLSWASKQGWKPTFVDLDIGQGSITIPGFIAATPIEMPLVYFYGHTTPRPRLIFAGGTGDEDDDDDDQED